MRSSIRKSPPKASLPERTLITSASQIVIANGSIVNANPSHNSDLFYALRGGGNNFGIVTRFDLTAFPHDDMWGGATVYPLTDNATIYNAYYWFNENAPTDPKAALIVSAFCLQPYGCLFSNDYEYIDPVSNPPIFDNFTSMANISSTARITSLPNLTEELKATQPAGYRCGFPPNSSITNHH